MNISNNIILSNKFKRTSSKLEKKKKVCWYKWIISVFYYTTLLLDICFIQDLLIFYHIFSPTFIQLNKPSRNRITFFLENSTIFTQNKIVYKNKYKI